MLISYSDIFYLNYLKKKNGGNGGAELPVERKAGDGRKHTVLTRQISPETEYKKESNKSEIIQY